MKERGRNRRLLLLVAGVMAFALIATACGSDDDATEQPPAATAEEATEGEHMDEAGEHMDEAGEHMDDAAVEIPEGAQVFEIETTEFAYTPSELTVEAGAPVAVRLHNEGGVEHDWTLHDAAGEEIAHVHVDPGEMGVAVFTVDAGVYELWCTVAGHKDAGMTGTLTAE